MNYDEHLVQLSLVRVADRRQPYGSKPTFELTLNDNQKVVGVESYWSYEVAARKTVDHHASVWVATTL